MSSDQTPYPRLLTRDGVSADSSPLSIPATGLALNLALGEDPDVVQELASAFLVIRVPESETDLTAELPGLVAATDQGAWDRATPRSVRWITVDWGSRRPITFLKVMVPEVTPEQDTKPPATIKIADGGAWFPPYPSEKITLDADHRIPAVIASRLMVELVQGDASKPWELAPYTSEVTGITVKAGNQLQDLSISVEDERPFFEQVGPILSGQRVSVGEELVKAVNLARSADQSLGAVPLLIRSQVQGEVEISFSGKVATVQQSLEGQGWA